MAKTIKESQKNRDPYKERGRYGEETDPISRRGSFRAGDAVLILLAVLLVAVLIVLASVIVPAVRENYREYKEELLITVDIPVTPERVERLPVPGDAWVLLDSDGAVCTVREVEYEEHGSTCRVTLLRRDAVYREGEGYLIAGTRISVGGTLYFRKDREEYFAATVTGIDSSRFPRAEETTAAETEADGEEDPNG